MSAPPPPTASLATYDLVIDLGRGVLFRCRPRVSGDLVFLTIDVNSPIGPFIATISMPKGTFVRLTELVDQYGVIPRLSELLEGTFGQRPVVRR